MFRRSSTGGRVRHSRRHSVAAPIATASPLPESRRARSFHLESSSVDIATQLRIQQIEQVTIAISADSRAEGDVRYVMTVRHAGAHAVWKMHRSFDEYHAFQKRMLRALHHGHACNASCPWLETFLTSYFPSQSAKLVPLWWDSSKMLTARRQQALDHVLQTVKTFLCTRQNHECPVLSSSVTSEFLEFVYGQVVDNNAILARAMARDEAIVRASFSRSRSPSPSRSNSSFASVHDDEPDMEEIPATEDDLRCKLCGFCMPERNVYVTQLRCGHRFHDECVLPKLNEALKCPVCGAPDDDT